MAASDPVPCYYSGQNYRWELPAEIRTRSEVRGFKKAKLGKFIENGKIFLFFQKVAEWAEQWWDGPLGIGNLLPFSKAHNYGDKLHYETPMAGDRTAFSRARMHREDDGKKLVTRTIHVSSRSLFSQQVLPAAQIA